MKLFTFAAVCCALPFSGLRAGTINVVNPSFELWGPGVPLTAPIYSYNTSVQPYGWTVTNENLEFGRTGYRSPLQVNTGAPSTWFAEDGSYAVDLNGVNAGNAVLIQTIAGLHVGYLTTVTFGLSANVVWCASKACTLSVSIDGTTKDYSV